MLLISMTGCVPWMFDPFEGAALRALELDAAPIDEPVVEAFDQLATTKVQVNVNAVGVQLVGAVNGEDDYDLFEFGPSTAGDRWRIESTSRNFAGRFVLALFDAEMNLLDRADAGNRPSLTHIFRRDSDAVFVGIATDRGRLAGDYRFRVTRERHWPIPAPNPQLVWINYAGGSDLTVRTLTGMNVAPFRGAQVGARFADQTQAIKLGIVAAVQRNYAGYNVQVVTSDVIPRPQRVHATIHVGGLDPRLLGLADNVDLYNSDPGQYAIAFAETFARYEPMQLTPEQLGQMIGNTVSHELGHLLGLYHTYGADNLMDVTAGTAWDLAEQRFLDPAPLAPTVFPVGQIDLPQLLADAVGLRPAPIAADLERPVDSDEEGPPKPGPLRRANGPILPMPTCGCQSCCPG